MNWRLAAASALFSLLLAGAVIVLAGYYERMTMLAGQLLFIALPSWAPLLILCGARAARGWWYVVFTIIVAAWGWIAWIDSRPYEGGGASFAVLLGWFGCAMACLIALFSLGQRALGRRNR